MLDPSFLDAIASIESGGKFDALGPVLKSGDRAYGRYQVMGANVGPWTKEILGFEMTPQQFFDSPEAQDAVFQGKFGQYVQKYGPEGAAQAWFAGPGGVGKLDRKDALGTNVGDYGKKFMLALGQPPQQQSTPQMQPVLAQNGPPSVLPQPMLGYGAPQNNAQAASLETQPEQADPALDEIAQLLPPKMLGGAYRRPADFRKLTALIRSIR